MTDNSRERPEVVSKPTHAEKSDRRMKRETYCLIEDHLVEEQRRSDGWTEKWIKGR